MLCLRTLFPFLLGLFLVSCSRNVPHPTGFLGGLDDQMIPQKNLPFGQSWQAPGSELHRYGKVFVTPVSTEQVRSLGRGLNAASERNIGRIRQKDIQKVATYLAAQFRAELPPNHFTSPAAPTPAKDPSRSLRLETNLVELVPGKPIAQILDNWIPFVSILNRPSLALEGRLVDEQTGEPVFAFSDREKAETALYDAQKFTYYGVHYREARRWASQLAETLRVNGKGTVHDSFPLKLVTW